jgi:hypothetical protein
VPAAELSDDIPWAVQSDPDLLPPPTQPTDAELEAGFWRNWQGWTFRERRWRLHQRREYFRYRALKKTYDRARADGMTDEEAARSAREAGDEAVRKSKRTRAKAKPDGLPQPAAKKKRGLGPIDDVAADLFVEKHQHDLRYVAAWGKWFEWGGGCWRVVR